MPFKLIAPVEKDFFLDRTDEKFENEGERSRVTFRQATQGAIERRAGIYSEVTQVVEASKNDGDIASVKLKQAWTMESLYRMEVFLTLIGSNLVDESGHDLFRFKTGTDGRSYLDMTEQQFAQVWGRLPGLVAQEMHEKCLELNLDWSQSGK